MKAALEFSVTPQFYADNLVEEQPHQIEGFGNRMAFVSGLCHYDRM